jgi:hypothetical protein
MTRRQSLEGGSHEPLGAGRGLGRGLVRASRGTCPIGTVTLTSELGEEALLLFPATESPWELWCLVKAVLGHLTVDNCHGRR